MLQMCYQSPVVAELFGINLLTALSLLDRLLLHHRTLCMLLSSWSHRDDHSSVGLKYTGLYLDVLVPSSVTSFPG